MKLLIVVMGLALLLGPSSLRGEQLGLLGVATPSEEPGRYRWFDGHSLHDYGHYFSPIQDTLPVENDGTPFEWGGTCLGMCVLTAEWYQRVVYLYCKEHGSSQGLDPRRRLRGIAADQYAKQVFIKAAANFQSPYRPIRDHWSWHELVHQHQHGRTRKTSVLGLTAEELWNGRLSGDPGRVARLLGRDVVFPRFGLSVISIWGRTTSGEKIAHAMVVFKGYRGRAEDLTTGRRISALKFRFYDPNQVETVCNQRKLDETQYLMYLDDLDRFAFSPEFIERYRRMGYLWQEGEVLAPNAVGYLPIHDELWQKAREAIANTRTKAVLDVEPGDAYDWPIDGTCPQTLQELERVRQLPKTQ